MNRKNDATPSRCTARSKKPNTGRAIHSDESKASPNHSPFCSASSQGPKDNTFLISLYTSSLQIYLWPAYHPWLQSMVTCKWFYALERNRKKEKKKSLEVDLENHRLVRSVNKIISYWHSYLRRRQKNVSQQEMWKMFWFSESKEGSFQGQTAWCQSWARA